MELIINKYLAKHGLSGVNGVNYSLQDDSNGKGIYVKMWKFDIPAPIFTKEDFAKVILEEKRQIAINKQKKYLDDTAWMIERFNDPSSRKPIPKEVLTKRTLTREKIEKIEGAKSLSEIAQIEAL